MDAAQHTSERIVARVPGTLAAFTLYAADARLVRWTADRTAAHRFADQGEANRAVRALCGQGEDYDAHHARDLHITTPTL